MTQQRELMVGQQLKVVSEALKLSTEVTTSLIVDKGWRASDLEALDTLVASLTSAMQSLTKLVHDQVTLIETARIIEGGSK